MWQVLNHVPGYRSHLYKSVTSLRLLLKGLAPLQSCNHFGEVRASLSMLSRVYRSESRLSRMSQLSTLVVRRCMRHTIVFQEFGQGLPW